MLLIQPPSHNHCTLVTSFTVYSYARLENVVFLAIHTDKIAQIMNFDFIIVKWDDIFRN